MNPLASNYTSQNAYQAALIQAGWNVGAAMQQAQRAAYQGLLGGETSGSNIIPPSTDSATPVNPNTTVNTSITGSTGTSTSSSSASNSITAGVTSTGNENVDQLQQAFADSISGSLASGFTINPGLNIGPDVLAQFVQETVPQLDPKYQQAFSSELNNVNVVLGQMATDYQNTQGQDIQNFQSSLGTLRDQTSMSGGGERALELGLVNSTNRSLSTLDANTAAGISAQLNAAGAQLGQGVQSNNAFGSTVPGLSGNAGSLAIPGLTGMQVSNQGGDSVFSGSGTAGNALNFNYNPSMYVTGAIPQAYSQDFLSLLNSDASNYQQTQIANGGTNQVTGQPTRTYSGLTSSSPGYIAQGSPQSTALGWYTGPAGTPVMNG